jgi:hypothetical protein
LVFVTAGKIGIAVDLVHLRAHALTRVAPDLGDFVELVTPEVSRPLRGGGALRTADLEIGFMGHPLAGMKRNSRASA